MHRFLEAKKCLLCGSAIEQQYYSERVVFAYKCPICGMVTLSEEAVLNLGYGSQESKHLLSGFTRERTEFGLKPIDIMASDIEGIGKSASVPRNVSEKLDRLLKYLEKKSDYPGKTVALIPGLDYPIAYALNSEELLYLLKQLASLNWIETPNVIGDINGLRKYGILLTVDGWNRIAEIARYPQVFDQAFVAMWFNEETEKAYKEGIEKAIADSGYKPLRVDYLEHNDIISDVIIAEIRKSKFLVADFTGHRGGVYFEAGFALGLGIPVIFLCRKDQIAQAHFDTRQYNHIVWENETELYQKLLNRINATIIR